MTATPDPILVPALKGGTVRHGFFTRDGGLSEGLYAGLNCGPGSSDNPDHVAVNRARVADWFGQDADRLSTLYQVHSADVVKVDAPIGRGAAPQADAMVTDRPGVILGILTADCGPLLFADLQAGIVGAAHAGWKGALTGVAQNTVAAMEQLGADRSRIVAALGPCIAASSYEVGPEFPAPFLEQDADNAAFFLPSARDGHHLFNLGGYLARQLVNFGVGRFETVERDTRTEEDLFFSYRRATLRGEADYGRQVSAIMIEGD